MGKVRKKTKEKKAQQEKRKDLRGEANYLLARSKPTKSMQNKAAPAKKLKQTVPTKGDGNFKQQLAGTSFLKEET